MRASPGSRPQKRGCCAAWSWPRRVRRLSTAAMHCFVWVTWAHAQTDEIQVYNAQIAAPGVFNLALHNNYTPDGLTSPPFPGGIAPNHTLNGVAEWAYGVTNWFEAGVYLPLYSNQRHGCLDLRRVENSGTIRQARCGRSALLLRRKY